MSAEVSKSRPKRDRRKTPGRGSFQVLDDSAGYDIAINVRFDPDKTDADTLRTALTMAYATAFAEVDKRL